MEALQQKSLQKLQLLTADVLALEEELRQLDTRKHELQQQLSLTRGRFSNYLDVELLQFLSRWNKPDTVLLNAGLGGGGWYASIFDYYQAAPPEPVRQQILLFRDYMDAGVCTVKLRLQGSQGGYGENLLFTRVMHVAGIKPQHLAKPSISYAPGKPDLEFFTSCHEIYPYLARRVDTSVPGYIDGVYDVQLYWLKITRRQ